MTYIKLSTLTFKVLHTGRPKYLTDLLHLHKPTRSMRSPYTQMLTVPRHNLSFGSRAFRISAPKSWNSPYFCTEKLEHFTT